MRLRRRLDLAFISGLVLVLLIGAISWLGASTFVSTVARTRADAQSIDALHSVLEDVLDIETGTRGFVITGHEEFLEPYERGVLAIHADLEELHRRVKGEQFRLLESQIASKLERSARTIQVRRTEGLAPAIARVTDGRGKAAMDDLRRSLAVIEDGLNGGMSDHVERGQRRTSLAITFTLLGGMAMLLLVILAATMVRRTITAPLASLAGAASDASQAGWKRPASVRDDEIGELERALADMVARREEAKTRMQELVDDAPEAFFL
ncbi:MAG TPA: CHASE3 domain-containing protein, partial [Kofleriaceae bacterium]|nr:CHASE3 domain-containing protein [Kofleriaceae bacterium]